jgi:hypothetical protein
MAAVLLFGCLGLDARRLFNPVKVMAAPAGQDPGRIEKEFKTSAGNA